jgi:hypothetical protein
MPKSIPKQPDWLSSPSGSQCYELSSLLLVVSPRHPGCGWPCRRKVCPVAASLTRDTHYYSVMLSSTIIFDNIYTICYSRAMIHCGAWTFSITVGLNAFRAVLRNLSLLAGGWNSSTANHSRETWPRDSVFALLTLLLHINSQKNSHIVNITGTES